MDVLMKMQNVFDIAEARRKVNFLQTNISQKSGRTYAGGLTKFEPREMERVIVPSPELLIGGAAGIEDLI